MANLVLELHKRGLIITGRSFFVKDLLKSLGGKWDPMVKGWLFVIDEDVPAAKAKLLRSLNETAQVALVEDRAVISLSIERREHGILVFGNTFPIRELLKGQGGKWDAVGKAWVFRVLRAHQEELIAALRSSGLIGGLENASVVVAASASKKATASTDARSDSAMNALAIKDATPERKGDRSECSSQQKGRALASRALQPTCSELQLGSKQSTASLGIQANKCSSNLKVIEKVRKVRLTKKTGDGSKQVETEAETKERRLCDKRTGSHIETTSVKRERKVVETKDEVIETRTIVVKRVRKK